MFMFLKLALGNVIKHRRTSITIVVVIFICILIMQFGVAFTDGFKAKLTGDYLNDAGHINIYNKMFYKELDFTMNDYNVPLTPEFLKTIRTFPGVKSVRPEINFGAIANTETKNLECFIHAIDPENAQANYQRLAASVIKGSFISGGNDIVIGKRGSEILGLKPGDKLVLLTVDQYGSISAVEGKICGIYRTFSAELDERGLVCALPLAQKLLGINGAATKVLVNLDNPFAAPETAARLEKLMPGDAVAVPWQKEQQFLVSYLAVLNVSILIMAVIIIFGASMGIINSFLMNIMNRLPEFGTMRAMGLGKLQMFFMIITESLILGVAGTLLAVLPGTMLVLYYQAHPLNYERIFRTMQGSPLGSIDATMGTVFLPASLAVVVITGILISVVASSYPALLALNKKPSEIMRVTE